MTKISKSGGVKKQQWKLILLLALCFNGFLLCATTCRAAQYSKAGQYKRSWYVNASFGLTIPSVRKRSHISTGAGFPADEYVVNNVSHEPLFSVSGGFAWNRTNTHLPFTFYSIGILYAHTSPITIKGHINLFSSSQFKNYNFRYKLSQQMVMLVFKTNLYRWKNLMPYLMLGGGIVSNTLSDYSERALPGVTTPRTSPDFKNETTQTIGYIVGAGVNYFILHNLALDLVYYYGYFGRAEIGPAQSAYLGNNLTNKRLTSHNVLLGVDYFF